MAVVEVLVPSGSTPVYEYPRRLPRHKHEPVMKQVNEWLRDGVIEECPMPSSWNMNLVVVAKAATSPDDPPKFRVCIDPRPINNLTPNDEHPLPHILDYLDEACGARVFTSLDLKGSFHQFAVRTEHKRLLAFTWNCKQYQFRRGPFGLKALAGQFQRVMSSILGDLHFVRVYIDDIIIISESRTEHMVHVAEVLKRLNHFKLKIQPLKCRFFRGAVPYLGHVVSGAGIRICGTRVVDIGKIPPPSSGKQVPRLLSRQPRTKAIVRIMGSGRCKVLSFHVFCICPTQSKLTVVLPLLRLG
jgi:hypothetical protein